MLHKEQPVPDNKMCKLRPTNVKSARDLVTGHINAPRVVEECEDVEEDVVAREEEEAVEDGRMDNRQMLLWRCRHQKFPKVDCNHRRELPQCPEARETSCALSWPARTAARAVGRSEASRPTDHRRS